MRRPPRTAALKQAILAALCAGSIAACAPHGVTALHPARDRAEIPSGAPVSGAAAHVGVPAPINAPAYGLDGNVGASDTNSLDAFIGQWHAHSFVLRIEADGIASADWRTYRWCRAQATPEAGQSVPCDSLHESRVQPGGHARLALGVSQADWASGQVQESTDPATLPLGPVRLQLAGHRLRLFQGSENLSRLVAELCGQGANSAGACGA